MLVGGKVLTARSQLKKQQILDAATELFTQHGYAISMDSIALAANVSKQTVYAHFKTKDDLFETCIRAKCMESQMDKLPLDDGRKPRDVLCDFAKRFQTILRSEEAIVTYRTAIRQLESHPDLAKVFVSAGPDTTIAMLAQYLSVQQQQGVLSFPISATDAAMQLLLMLHGRMVFLAQLGQPCDMTEQENDAYIESCVDLFMTGYAAKK